MCICIPTIHLSPYLYLPIYLSILSFSLPICICLSLYVSPYPCTYTSPNKLQLHTDMPNYPYITVSTKPMTNKKHTHTHQHRLTFL